MAVRGMVGVGASRGLGPVQMRLEAMKTINQCVLSLVVLLGFVLGTAGLSLAGDLSPPVVWKVSCPAVDAAGVDTDLVAAAVAARVLPQSAMLDVMRYDREYVHRCAARRQVGIVSPVRVNYFRTAVVTGSDGRSIIYDLGGPLDGAQARIAGASGFVVQLE